MPWIMAIRKSNDNGRPIQRMGPLLCAVSEEPDTGKGDEALPEEAVEDGATSSGGEDAPYNRDEEGVGLRFAGKLSGRRKLRDIDVVRLRRNEEQLSYNQWAQIFRVSPFVIWNAMKGYTYKHLNWKYPPLR